jgi:hypothetical protein
MYFIDFQEEATVIDHDDFLRAWGPQYWQPIWISIDWGSSHHAYAAWHTFVTFNMKGGGTVDIPITYREWLVKGLADTTLAQEIVERTPVGLSDRQNERKRVTDIYLSPDTGFESELMRGYRIGSVFVQYDMPRAQPAFNERIGGWRLMDDLLRARVEIEMAETFSVSQWLITENCEHAIQSIPRAVADPKKQGDIMAKGDNPSLDVLDGLRYGIASHIKPEEKPFAEREREILIQLPVAGSSRYIKSLQLRQEERQNAMPVYLGGSHGKWRRR